MEAMRRFDDFQRLRALVPDHAYVVAAEGRPTAPAGEADGELMRRVWTRVRSGTSVGDCERLAEVDSFRVRALLVHWLDDGAIRVEVARATPATEPFLHPSEGG